MALANSTFTGNLTKDPVLKEFNGRKVCYFTVAFARNKFNQQSNQWEQFDTTFAECSVSQRSERDGKPEAVAQQLLKGMKVTVTGDTFMSERQGKDGTTYRNYCCYVSEVAATVKPQSQQSGGWSGGGAQQGGGWNNQQPQSGQGFDTEADEPPF